ncbi:hypothetical protein V8C44DRAFT_188575 [Trichoderma aethiopicum]
MCNVWMLLSLSSSVHSPHRIIIFACFFLRASSGGLPPGELANTINFLIAPLFSSLLPSSLHPLAKETPPGKRSVTGTPSPSPASARLCCLLKMSLLWCARTCTTVANRCTTCRSYLALTRTLIAHAPPVEALPHS